MAPGGFDYKRELQELYGLKFDGGGYDGSSFLGLPAAHGSAPSEYDEVEMKKAAMINELHAYKADPFYDHAVRLISMIDANNIDIVTDEFKALRNEDLRSDDEPSGTELGSIFSAITKGVGLIKKVIKPKPGGTIVGNLIRKVTAPKKVVPQQSAAAPAHAIVQQSQPQQQGIPYFSSQQHQVTEKKDRTMLLVGLGVGFLTLVTITAFMISRKSISGPEVKSLGAEEKAAAATNANAKEEPKESKVASTGKQSEKL